MQTMNDKRALTYAGMTIAGLFIALVVSLTTRPGPATGSRQADPAIDPTDLAMIRATPLIQAELSVGDDTPRPFVYVGHRIDGDRVVMRFWATTKTACENPNPVLAVGKIFQFDVVPMTADQADRVVYEIVDPFALKLWTRRDNLWSDSPWTDWP